MVKRLLTLVGVVLVSSAAQAQTQSYLSFRDQSLKTGDKDFWEFIPEKEVKGKTLGGYYQCRWVASKDGKPINDQLVLYFPNNPANKNDTAKSNYWVYWFKVTDKQELIGWARCPTPKHPDYKKMQKAAKGKDLWQIIPDDKRKKGVVTVARLQKAFGETISTEDKGLPKIAKDETETITCIDFSNPIFN
jgi:hypothetical protein